VGGREIFANRGTITGSIGIFYGKADVSGLLTKLGVQMDHYRSAPRADAESLFRPFTDDEKRELGVKVKQFYDLFVARVAEGRHLTPEAVDAVARGKVWTGQQAIGKGLVDKLGGLREALEEARRLGRLPADAPIAEWPVEDDSLLGFLLDAVGVHLPLSELGTSLPAALLPFAQLLAPFLVFEPNKPLAHAEIGEETSGHDEDPRSAGSGAESGE
jgi:protease-4